jgi:hypothetical protein
MDVLSHLVAKAEEGLLQPQSNRGLQPRISLYADDVVLFLRPLASDIEFMTELLQFFLEKLLG